MKKSMLLITSALALCGCQNSNVSVEPDSNSESGVIAPDFSYEVTPHEWIDERDVTYENLIDFPQYNEVHNIDELQAICDFYAFYKVEKFSVKLASDYKWNVKKGSVERELNYLYWHEELINGVLGMNAVKNGDYLDFTYTIYHNAHLDSEQFVLPFTNLLFEETHDLSNEETLKFSTDDTSRKIADVYSTQQLWYAAEKGYCINPIKDSPAEYYYNEAKELLFDIIAPEMDYFTRVKTIYDYISNTSTYDYQSAYIDDYELSDPDLYPDEYAAQCKCYFLEGYFDNRLLVCDGFAKLYTLLGSMVGIDIFRATGIDDNKFKSRSEAGHAYCFVNFDGTYYLSDITWGQTILYANESGNFLSVNTHGYFAGKKEDMAPYISICVDNIDIYNPEEDGEPIYFTKYFEETYFNYNSNKQNLIFDRPSTSKVSDIVNLVLEGGYGSYVNAYFADSVDFNIVADFIDNPQYQDLRLQGYLNENSSSCGEFILINLGE